MGKSLLEQARAGKKPKKEPEKEIKNVFNEAFKEAEMMPELVLPEKPVKETKKNFSNDQKFELTTISSETALYLPSKEEVDYRVQMIEYIKKSVVSKEDYGSMFNKAYLRASGYDKFIHYFKLNVSYPKREIYEDKEGWHCDVVCRVEAPWGQVVEAYGGASMDTMTIRKTRHNMKALADTRAKTRAVRTIMGFSQPSYEEMIGSEDKEDWF